MRMSCRLVLFSLKRGLWWAGRGAGTCQPSCNASPHSMLDPSIIRGGERCRCFLSSSSWSPPTPTLRGAVLCTVCYHLPQTNMVTRPLSTLQVWRYGCVLGWVGGGGEEGDANSANQGKKSEKENKIWTNECFDDPQSLVVVPWVQDGVVVVCAW